MVRNRQSIKIDEDVDVFITVLPGVGFLLDLAGGHPDERSPLSGQIVSKPPAPIQDLKRRGVKCSERGAGGRNGFSLGRSSEVKIPHYFSFPFSSAWPDLHQNCGAHKNIHETSRSQISGAAEDWHLILPCYFHFQRLTERNSLPISSQATDGPRSSFIGSITSACNPAK
eukprot:1157151-Pelagomonas_calceolata.AAC.6